MAIVTTKSASITGLDASPPFWSPIGEGGAGPKQTISDFVAATSGDSIGSIYRFCRVPTNAKIKRVRLSSLVTGAGAGDIDIAYSDSLTDGTNPILQAASSGIVQISAADNKIFGSAVTLTTPIKYQDQTFANIWTIQNSNQPLWAALINLGVTQFSSDPGGKFDFVIKLTTGISVASGTIGLEVGYVV
jgi:hypothetical protein